MCDSVNHTRFPKEDHPPDWARRDNKFTKDDRVEYLQRKTELLGDKPIPSSILYTTNFTRAGLASNPGLRGEIPATNRIINLYYI